MMCHHTVVGNVCRCENGVAQTGVGCPMHRIAKCESCNVGWTINYDKSKCIRTYEYVHNFGWLDIAEHSS